MLICLQCHQQHCYSHCWIYSLLPFLKIDHTMWNKGTVSCACTCTLPCRVQMFPMEICIILCSVIIALRFLDMCQSIHQRFFFRNSQFVFEALWLYVPHRALF